MNWNVRHIMAGIGFVMMGFLPLIAFGQGTPADPSTGGERPQISFLLPAAKIPAGALRACEAHFKRALARFEPDRRGLRGLFANPIIYSRTEYRPGIALARPSLDTESDQFILLAIPFDTGDIPYCIARQRGDRWMTGTPPDANCGGDFSGLAIEGTAWLRSGSTDGIYLRGHSSGANITSEGMVGYPVRLDDGVLGEGDEFWVSGMDPVTVVWEAAPGARSMSLVVASTDPAPRSFFIHGGCGFDSAAGEPRPTHAACRESRYRVRSYFKPTGGKLHPTFEYRCALADPEKRNGACVQEIRLAAKLVFVGPGQFRLTLGGGRPLESVVPGSLHLDNVRIPVQHTLRTGQPIPFTYDWTHTAGGEYWLAAGARNRTAADASDSDQHPFDLPAGPRLSVDFTESFFREHACASELRERESFCNNHFAITGRFTDGRKFAAYAEYWLKEEAPSESPVINLNPCSPFDENRNPCAHP